MDPTSPSWRPDPTGRRLATIRMARRGGLLAAIVFAPIGALAVATLPALNPIETPFGSLLAGLAAMAALAGVGLLGAGLAPAAIGSKIDGMVVALAFGIGVPVAAVTSALIGTFMAESAVHGFDHGANLAGQVLRTGVSDAVRLAPLIALASAFWVVVVRRWGTPAGG